MIETKPELRHAFGRFATGIAVITTLNKHDVPYGITINSFSSVSMAPPIISWNVIRGSTAHTTICRAQRFAVNILGKNQRHIAQQMTGPIESRFHLLECDRSEDGLPLIPNALATFVCSTHALVEAGDHAIVLGLVNDFSHRDGDPLVYWKGGYATAMHDSV